MQVGGIATKDMDSLIGESVNLICATMVVSTIVYDEDMPWWDRDNTEKLKLKIAERADPNKKRVAEASSTVTKVRRVGCRSPTK